LKPASKPNFPLQHNHPSENQLSGIVSRALKSSAFTIPRPKTFADFDGRQV
jgi:hypothetical protein